MGADAEIAIETFDARHVEVLVPMWRESFESGVGMEDPHSLGEQANYLLSEVVPNNAVRVAFLGNQMVGFVAASPASISQLHVRKGFQRRGIGVRLLDWAKSQSSGSLWLFTFERNAAARAFYEKHGFTVVARGHEPNWDLDDIRYQWQRDDAI